MREDKVDVVVLGAGASGLFCAAACGKRGRSVLVLDHAERIGSKIRVSGGGRCNFTNREVTAGHYRSRNPHFGKSALARFTPEDIVSILAKHGVPYVEREAGQLFCARSSRDVVALLEKECRDAGIDLRLGCRVTQIRKLSDFIIMTSHGRFRADSLVVATGGLSYAALGASGFGHDIARQFGLGIIEPRPALAPFVFPEPERRFSRELAGVSMEAAITRGSKIFRGRILFTHRGLSGPAALQASLYWNPGESIRVDLLPEKDVLGDLLSRRRGKAQVPSLLAGYLPKRFAQSWCERRGLARPVNQIPEKALRELAVALHAWEIAPSGTEGYATAEATSGGVDTNDLSSKTMEAKKVPGLYFIGEVVDMTGEVGGYNLHWAWASGFVAGQYA